MCADALAYMAISLDSDLMQYDQVPSNLGSLHLLDVFGS